MEVVDIKRSEMARLAMRIFLVVNKTYKGLILQLALLLLDISGKLSLALLEQKAARREKLARVPMMIMML